MLMIWIQCTQVALEERLTNENGIQLLLYADHTSKFVIFIISNIWNPVKEDTNSQTLPMNQHKAPYPANIKEDTNSQTLSYIRGFS